MSILVNEKNVVDEKALADAIAIHAEEMRQRTILDLITGLRGFADALEQRVKAQAGG